MTRSSAFTAACALVAAGASLGLTSCAGADELPTRDLGDTSALLTSSAEATGGAGERLDVIHGGFDAFLTGHWVGQAENAFASAGPDGERPVYVFPSGSTDITLDLEIVDGIEVTGQIVFGAGPLPEPLPGVAFPPGMNHYYAFFASQSLTSHLIPPTEGFEYRVAEVIPRLSGVTGTAAGVLSVSYSRNTPFESWCALQPALPEGDGDFNCIGAAGFAGGNPLTGDPCIKFLPDGTEEPVDCNLAALCLSPPGMCSCTADGCELIDNPIEHLWLNREGDELVGNFAGAVFDYGTPGRFLPLGTVRFRRESL